MRTKLLSIVLSLGIIGLGLGTFSSISKVNAEPIFKIQYKQPNLMVTQTSANNYNLQVGNNVLHVGNPNVTSSFSAKTDFPDWQGYAWNADLNLTMGVVGNAVAMAGMTSTSTSTSVTAGNSYFNITYSGVNVNPPFNETGGLDMNITIKKSIGNTLAFAYNKTNVNAYLQPSLTKEWTVGQDLGDGRTVGTVTDTDVTDNLGNNVTHRPDYVVNAIAFMNATAGGMVSDVQAATGLTTGQIGMLYRMKMTGANGVTAWADWSIPNGTNLWLNLNTTGMTYPIVISPAGDTFGYGGNGATSFTSSDNKLFGMVYPAGASSSVDSISAYAYTSSGSCNIKAVFQDAVGNILTNGIGGTVALGNSVAWKTMTYASKPTFTNGTSYEISSVFSTSAGTEYWFYTSGTGSKGYSNRANSYASPFSTSLTSTLDGSMSIYCTYTAAGTYNLTNDPTSIDFGVIQPNTKYYAYGSAPSNPVAAGECTFTITNAQANIIKVNIKASNFTGGGGWTLGAPDGTHARLIAYTTGMNPASGVTLTTSDQTFVASLASSATIKWDFSWETATAFVDGSQKSSTITLTGVAP